MARFLNGLNEEILGFVEMFPYHNLQGLVDQAMRIERKIQQEGRRRSNDNQSFSAPWQRQQAGTSVVGGQSQVVAARPAPSIVAAKMAVSTTSSPAIQQEKRRPSTSTAAPSVASAAASSSHSRGIVCHKCQVRGHVAAQCPSPRTMIINENLKVNRRKMLQDMMKNYSMMKVRKFNPMKGTIIVLFLAKCLVLLL